MSNGWPKLCPPFCGALAERLDELRGEWEFQLAAEAAEALHSMRLNFERIAANLGDGLAVKAQFDGFESDRRRFAAAHPDLKRPNAALREAEDLLRAAAGELFA